MKFDVYYSFLNKEGKVCPGIKPNPMTWDEIKEKVLTQEKVTALVQKYRETGDTDMKKWLPSICFVGRCTSTRKRASMIPTQLIMIDIDHCENPEQAWKDLSEKMGQAWVNEHVVMVHVTPSGHGLHLILHCAGYDTLEANMDWYNEQCDFASYGEYDKACKDFSRLSFAFPVKDLLFESMILFAKPEPTFEETLVNREYEEPKQSNGDGNGQSSEGGTEKVPAKTSENKYKDSNPPTFTSEEKILMDDAEWKGNKLRTIIAEWVNYRGEPGENEIHNYYNEMVKYFRNIMGNNKKLIFHLLPRFGHTAEECWSQVNSICRSNTLSQIDKPFYFFLKDKGFFVNTKLTSIDSYMLAEESETNFGAMPTPPPVFREFIKSAPKDFKIPAINALMPILGTLTSYLKAIYPYDDQEHTTSFFSIVYAPPGTGKGFVNRFDFLFDDLRLRDQIQQAREDVYLRFLNRKGANDKSPEQPHTSLRLIPPKNSEAEFLQKQKDNGGMHMFTFAAEMDSWAKGEKAAGGNKSDMIRIAWDNGEYGQQFKSANTFKGKVKLYWNVLITGTQAQVESYFRNVENGLVTRCSFTSIENQEFQLASHWSPINKKGMEIIKNFMRRCDDNTYEEPCTITMDDLAGVNDEEFDKQVKWRFNFRERQLVDISWIMPMIDAFHREQCEKASLDLDRARDVFRRRVGVRGFRLALLCTALYPKVNNRAVETIKAFVNWWMHVDLESMLKLWGAKYNEVAEVEPQLYNRNAFHLLKDVFTKNDLFVVLKQQRIKSPIRTIIYQWKRAGYIDKIDKDTYKKKQK